MPLGRCNGIDDRWCDFVPRAYTPVRVRRGFEPVGQSGAVAMAPGKRGAVLEV